MQNKWVKIGTTFAVLSGFLHMFLSYLPHFFGKGFFQFLGTAYIAFYAFKSNQEDKNGNDNKN